MKHKTITRAKEIAFALCPTNWGHRSSHIAFLVKSNKILHIGQNKRKTHPIIQHHPYHEGYTGIHAELDVILKAGKEELFDYCLLVLRVDRNGRLANSKPCVGCQSLIMQFGIHTTWYSTDDQTIVKL